MSLQRILRRIARSWSTSPLRRRARLAAQLREFLGRNGKLMLDMRAKRFEVRQQGLKAGGFTCSGHVRDLGPADSGPVQPTPINVRDRFLMGVGWTTIRWEVVRSE